MNAAAARCRLVGIRWFLCVPLPGPSSSFGARLTESWVTDGPEEGDTGRLA